MKHVPKWILWLLSLTQGVPMTIIGSAAIAKPTTEREGCWLINPDGWYPYCSKCRYEPKNGELTNFCPNCGAKMKGEKK